MRLSEIDKATFHRKLADPAAQELIDRGKNLANQFGYRVKFHGEDKESAMVEFSPSPFEDDGMAYDEANPVSVFRYRIENSDYWVWDTWEGEVWEGLGWNAYVIRKDGVNEAKLSKDQFVKRLQDPRRGALEKKLQEWDDVLRNRLKWRLDWSEWELDNNVITVTAYRPRTLPVPTGTVEDIRQNLWSFLLQDRWDEKNDIEITFEEEDEDSVTWEFYLRP